MRFLFYEVQGIVGLGGHTLSAHVQKRIKGTTMPTEPSTRSLRIQIESGGTEY